MKFITKKVKDLFGWVLYGVVGFGIGLVIAYVLSVPCFLNFGHPVMELFDGAHIEKCSFVDYTKCMYNSVKDSISHLINKDKETNPIVTITVTEYTVDKASSKRHYYSLLNDNSKNIYNELYKEARKLNSDIKIKGNFTKEEIENAITYFNYDHPEYFFLDLQNCNLAMHYNLLNKGKNVYYDFTLKYKGDTSNLEREYYKNVFIAEEILKNIENKSEKEGIRYIHDYIVKNVDYSLDSINNQDLRSSMQNGESVCAGYAKMFKYLCDEAGYDCIYVVGEADTSEGRGYHAWNMVWIDNESYCVDVTWDDSTNSNKYFLISNEQMSINHFAEEASTVLCNK